MYDVLIITNSLAEGVTPPWAADSEGVAYHIGAQLEGPWNGDTAVRPDAVLLDLAALSDARARSLASQCRELGLPAVGVVSQNGLSAYDSSITLNDYILQPFRPGELLLRLDQATFKMKGTRNGTVIRTGDLVIDTDRYEVRMAGERVFLTYKEYQLLVLLASNPKKVYTRDSLLSQVWGYDYFGGTRTVDVHIRRLRSKIEDATHLFIETIRNVGYRFQGGP